MGIARSYLDNAASAPLSIVARQAMDSAWSVVGNPHSLHESGRGARRVLEEARERLAAAVGARPTEIVFTSGGSEANNLALLGGRSAHQQRDPERRRLAISAIEHPSVDAVRAHLPGSVDVLDVNEQGRVALDEAAHVIGKGTALVSVMWINNETGVVQPLPEVVALARQAAAWVHTDAVQALGHVSVSFADLDLDAMTISAHKVGGPVGIGALVLRRGLEWSPIGFGGGQERRLRSGTAPVALAAGFAAAAEAAVADLSGEVARLTSLRQRLVAGLTRLDQVRLNGEGVVSPAIVHATFTGARADDLLLLLDREGVDASTGSACTAGVHQPSHVLRAMGRSDADCSSGLRFSFGPTTTDVEVDRLLSVLPDALAQARAAYR